MKAQNYLWAVPFFCFIAGYLFLQWMSKVQHLEAPALVGKQLQDAVAQLSRKNLNIRLIAQKEDPDLPGGTILSQSPAAGQKIKPHQAIHAVISKKPEKISAPNLLNKSQETLDRELKALGIRSKIHFLPSNRPANSCIAQYPAPGQPIEENRITIYLSSDNQKQVLVPDFRQQPACEVLEFLQQYNTKVELSHASHRQNDHKCGQNCLVIDQRPLAGSLITLSPEKPLLVQLKVK